LSIKGVVKNKRNQNNDQISPKELTIKSPLSLLNFFVKVKIDVIIRRFIDKDTKDMLYDFIVINEKGKK